MRARRTPSRWITFALSVVIALFAITVRSLPRHGDGSVPSLVSGKAVVEQALVPSGVHLEGARMRAAREPMAGALPLAATSAWSRELSPGFAPLAAFERGVTAVSPSRARALLMVFLN